MLPHGSKFVFPFIIGDLLTNFKCYHSQQEWAYKSRNSGAKTPDGSLLPSGCLWVN